MNVILLFFILVNVRTFLILIINIPIFIISNNIINIKLLHWTIAILLKMREREREAAVLMNSSSKKSFSLNAADFFRKRWSKN